MIKTLSKQRMKKIHFPNTQGICVAKIYKTNHIVSQHLLFETELTALQVLNHHSSIAILVHFSRQGQYRKKNGEEYSCMYIVTRFCPNGNLHKLVEDEGGISEDNLKILTTQLFSAMAACRDANIVHRNIKLENILIDTNGSIRLTGFHTCVNLNSPLPRVSYSCMNLTYNYVSPEIAQKSSCETAASDVFSVGTVLLSLRIGRPVFRNPYRMDPFYNLFQRDKEAFWLNVGAVYRNVGLSNGFKNFIEKFLYEDKNSRWSVDQLRTHPWMTS